MAMIKGHFYRRLAANTVLCCLWAGSLLVASEAQGRSIRWLPSYGTPRAVANDGTVVTSSGLVLPDGTYVQLRDALWGGTYTLYDISADGRTVVGYRYHDYRTYWPVIWRYPGRVERLLPWAEQGIATGVSADGSTVAGYIFEQAGPGHAFQWRNGKGSLFTASSPQATIPWAVSADGSVIVGYLSSYIGYSPFVWEKGITRELPTWGGRFNKAYSVSGDGSVVVGFATTTSVGTWEYYDYWRAAVWVHGRLLDIGSLGRQESEALDVSGDGRIVVGSAWDRYYYQERGHGWRYYKTNYIAFVWTPDSGIRPLQEVFGDLLASGTLLLTADAISPNGRYILGIGYDASSQRSSPFLIDTW
ncbi:MAG: hypothetical protein AB1725_07110 [Armatimonadota bacterium]